MAFKNNNISKENFQAQTVSTNRIFNRNNNIYNNNSNDINLDI